MDHGMQKNGDRAILTLINQLADLDQKINRISDADSLRRHMTRIRDTLAEMSYAYEIPLGERFSETRTDVEAHIAGESTADLRIVQVIKPVIRYRIGMTSRVVQKGVVVVQQQKESTRG